MLFFLFLFVIFLVWLVLRRRLRIPRLQPAWVRPLALGLAIGALLHFVKRQFTERVAVAEGFENEESGSVEVSVESINQALIDGGNQTELIVELFKKYQELLKKYTAIKGTSKLSVAECEGKLKDTEAQLEAALLAHQKYREKILLGMPEYLKKNYIKKERVQKFVSKNCDFTKYDVTKHPDFTNRCSDPTAYNIVNHRNYVTPKSLNDYDVTEHEKFASECQKRVNAHVEEVRKSLVPSETRERAVVDITKNRQFASKCKAQCANPEFFRARDHPTCKRIVNSLTNEKILLKEQNQVLSNRNKALQGVNANLQRQCREVKRVSPPSNGSVEAIRIRTVRDCPNLENLLAEVRREI